MGPHARQGRSRRPGCVFMARHGPATEDVGGLRGESRELVTRCIEEFKERISCVKQLKVPCYAVRIDLGRGRRKMLLGEAQRRARDETSGTRVHRVSSATSATLTFTFGRRHITYRKPRGLPCVAVNRNGAARGKTLRFARAKPAQCERIHMLRRCFCSSCSAVAVVASVHCCTITDRRRTRYLVSFLDTNPQIVCRGGHGEITRPTRAP
jgi:hypothetical protein